MGTTRTSNRTRKGHSSGRWVSYGKEQRRLWEYSLKENGLAYTKQFVALPGCSEHQIGLAIDVGLKKQEDDDLICPHFRDSAAADLFMQQMMNYGFILRYPEDKQEITGISYEPWHFRYVGLPHSQVITPQNGLWKNTMITLLRQ